MDPWSDVEAILKREIEKYGQNLVSQIPSQFGGGRHVTVQNDLLAAIDALPEMEYRKGSMIVIGSSAFTIQSHVLGTALILRSLRDGYSKALDDLRLFFSSENTGYSEIILLGGISVDERIEIGDDIYICPPEEVPVEDFQKKHSESKDGRHNHFARKFDLSDPKVVGAAIIREKCINAKFVNPSEFSNPSNFAALASSIHYVPLLLTLAGPSSPTVYRHFCELDNDEFLKGTAPDSFSSWGEETRVASHVHVARDNFAGFSEVVTRFESLPDSERNHLTVSLHRLNESIRHRNPVDKALDLGIALESLLLSGKREKEQLSLQFRLRGAWLLGQDGAHRNALYKQFQELYELRSLAAHTGTISTKKGSSVDIVLAQGQSICADAIKKIILRGGYPDWNSLLVGADYVVEPETDD
ncbi:HEPN domain-containing protein [Burkholderia cepacia]|uniref:HEPN domain-containing protein n=1 Tax=Burkholderia cepacia TaxID=292 RepID=UPI001590B84E|nr:HEPN domain-containing protein [Burkholderia cepacia]